MTRAERRRLQCAEAKAANPPKITEARPRWNGEPCEAVKVRVIVGPSPRPTWWCADIEGAEREAVRVTYCGQVFYIDNEDGSGWRKVTDGGGGPSWPHRSVPVDREVEA